MFCFISVLLLQTKKDLKYHIVNRAENGHNVESELTISFDQKIKKKDIKNEDVDQIGEHVSEVMIEDSSAKAEKLPGIAVVGVKKCGTGALLEILRMHPEVVVPSYEKTEVSFWGQENLLNKGIAYYKVHLDISN